MPCAPLGDWLGLLRVGHVDLFSLDVEGAELLVLETLDWSRFSVGLMIVECAGSGSHGCLDRKDRAVTALLLSSVQLAPSADAQTSPYSELAESWPPTSRIRP